MREFSTAWKIPDKEKPMGDVMHPPWVYVTGRKTGWEGY
jgi:hypothetical protein